ncbi:MAG: hypothetical protein ACEPOV_13225 [Hyphomicrobiales bacterium]
MNILFVCFQNTSRSPIAEGVLKKLAQYGGIDINVESAGCEPYLINHAPVSNAIEIAAKHDIDISNKKARLFSKDDFEKFDLIYAMDTRGYREVKNRIRNSADLHKLDYFMNIMYPGQNRVLHNPEEFGTESYEDLFNNIKACCEKLLDTASKKKM